MGKSCLHLSTNSNALILDCGAHPALVHEDRFPDFHSIPSLENVSAIVISHFHVDHAAALPLLTEKLACPAPVYMTAPTLRLASLMLLDFVSTSIARNHYCPFSAADVRRCLDKVNVLELGKTVQLKSDVHLTSYYAGHALGAVMLQVDIQGIRILYSGDYANGEDRHLRPAFIPVGLRPDLFITETTYCGNVRCKQSRETETNVVDTIVDTVTSGGKVLVPVSAYGKVQAVCALLASHWKSQRLESIPMFLVSGLASKANQIYEQFAEWMPVIPTKLDETGQRKQKKARIACPILSKLRPFNMKGHQYLLNATGPMILFATPGTLSTGISKQVFKMWAGDARNAIVCSGYSFSNAMASQLLADAPSFQQPPPDMRCKMASVTYASHVDGDEIIQACRQLEPKTIMLVHGEETKVLNFQSQLKHIFQGIDCYAPANGDIVTVTKLPHRVPNSVHDNLDEHLHPTFKQFINSYVHKMQQIQLTAPRD